MGSVTKSPKSGKPIKGAKGPRKKQTPEQKEQKRRERNFIAQNRKPFLAAGFNQVPGVDGHHFQFRGLQSELDDILVFENVILLVEYTLSSSSNLGDHAKGKSASHNAIASYPAEFIECLSSLSNDVEFFSRRSTTP